MSSPEPIPHVPALYWTWPFALLLLCIAVLPLFRKTADWWHHNRNKLLVAISLGLVTLGYYQFRGYGFSHGAHTAAPGLATLLQVLHFALLREYVPFMSFLFALYVIAGGIAVKGDIPAHPFTNVVFLAIGGLLANLIGTTGASMLLIRPLLATNSERKHVAHTVVFFIFIVSNIGGSLLPIGDPPLFLGFLRGVPFLWTLCLWKEWAFCLVLLLVVYYVWDCRAYRHETVRDIRRDEARVRPLALHGKINFFWLAGVILVTASFNPNKHFLGSAWTPPHYLREILQCALVAASLASTPAGLRRDINFNYAAILEVACLFLGIFVCMQVPLEILISRGAEMGIDTPIKFFWATGILSSFLDNAPTYAVLFETANALTHQPGDGVIQLLSGHYIRQDHLVAISLGAVFMGANTYIGNGPNFMVRTIAEHEGVHMPSFFGFLLYSLAILIPLFVLITMFFLT